MESTIGPFRGYLGITLEAQLPIHWVPVLRSLYNFVLSVTQGPTIWVPGLLWKMETIFAV